MERLMVAGVMEAGDGDRQVGEGGMNMWRNGYAVMVVGVMEAGDGDRQVGGEGSVHAVIWKLDMVCVSGE
ncbi:hypothetical protein L6452_18552 [Arctium lappa]|uniref:Uncharacterized protein n=1 Tax=Arctium lappa TaxID=4217 RepID=A0ACB9C6L7_ARCLA|nr:hypothetical protein L6452_18552 [Arctium lappa]